METKTIKVNKIEKNNKKNKLKNIDPDLINALRDKETAKKLLKAEKIKSIIEENELLS